MFWERAIWLSLDDQQIGRQSLHHVVQGIASDRSHDTPFNFDLVLGKGAGQVFQPRFDISRLFSAGRLWCQSVIALRGADYGSDQYVQRRISTSTRPHL
jgi:hypothetical protein